LNKLLPLLIDHTKSKEE
jgi:cullin-associated NEDD8-dissociated protein 1